MKHLEELQWIEELLPADAVRKPMFGGFAYYREQRLILVLFESEGDRTYRGQKFDFDLWNGCMFPLERDFHEEALKKYSYLRNHPILPKWLYLPLQTEDFEEKAQRIIKRLGAPQSFWGVIPKSKNKKKKATSKKSSETREEKIDTRQPRMFSEEPVAVDFAKIKNISDLKNLGPATEKEFHKAGIKTPLQFQKLGWKKTIEKLTIVNPKNAHSVFAYALIGALNNKEWFRLSPEEKQDAQEWTRKLRKAKSATK